METKKYIRIVVFMIGIYLIVTSTISLMDRHRWVQSGSSRAIDTVYTGTTPNDGTGATLLQFAQTFNDLANLADSLGLDDMTAQDFTNLRNLIDSLNIHVDVNDTATMLLHYAQLAEVSARINDTIEARLAAAEEGVLLTTWNNGIEDNYLKALQAAGMSIKAGPAMGLYPRVTHTIYDGSAIWTLFYVSDTTEVTGVGFIQDTQGAYTADNYNGFALYSVSGTTYTKLDSTANDGNIWKTAANTSATRAFSAGARELNPGIYYVFLVYNSSAQTTAPKIYFNNDFQNAAFSALTGTNKIAGTVAAQTTPPITETGGDVTASAEIPAIWLY